MTLPADHLARERALDPTGSFAVSAPAGSGKTGLLTQRILRLLASSEAPEEVLAITFTRKAAGEMRERLLSALQVANSQPCPEQAHAATSWHLARAVLKRDSEQDWQLLQNPNRLRLQTIDGLCRQLARQLPFESGLGSIPEPVEQPGPLYRRAVRALYGLLETDSPLADDLALILTELDNRYDTFEGLLVNLLANRDQWLSLALASGDERARSELELSIKDIIYNNLYYLFKVLSDHGNDLMALAHYAATNLQAEAKPCVQLGDQHRLPEPNQDNLGQCLPIYRALADLLLTNSNGWRKRLDKNMGFPPERAPDLSKQEAKAAKDRLSAIIASLSDDPELLEALTSLRLLPPPAYLDNQWALLSALSRLLPRLVAELTLIFASEGAADFIDTTQAALRALGQFDEPSELALRLDYQIRHLLIDEFQDTSAPQRALVEHLTAGWEAGDGRTLFIVGDGMQSCYGFRNANVGIFLQARQGGIGDVALEPLDLTVNFRSQAGIVDWVNTTFANAFPSADNIARGAVAYLPSQAAKAALPEPAVRTSLIAAGEEDDNSEWLASAEATLVVNRISQLRAQDPEQSIALLARNRPHLRAILRRLDTEGIRYQAAELDKLADRMAVQDMVCLLRALLDPVDRISWLALLRAPWSGLDNQDLLTIARHSTSIQLADGWPSIPLSLQDPTLTQKLSHEGQLIITRVLEVLNQTQARWGRKALRDDLEGCWQNLGGPQTLRSSADLANCQRLLQLVEVHTEGAGIRDWQAFEEAIGQLYAAPDADSDPCLQVMTIHKSKGLEFDQVLIPGLHRCPRQDERSLLLWLEQIDPQGQAHTLLSPISNFEESELYQFIREEKKARNRAEAVRLFYVGCTRAIRQLHLFATVKSKEGELQTPAAESLLASVWDTVVEQALVHQPGELAGTPVAGDRLEGSHRIARLQPHWQFTPPADPGLLAAYRGRQLADQEPDTPLNRPTATLYDADARALGTELHRLIEHFIRTASLPDQAYLQTLSASSQGRLRASRHTAPAKAWQQIQQALLTMTASDKGRWLLNPDHPNSATELPLWTRSRSGPRQYVIDRTFVHDAVRWVVDFKSSQPEADQTLDAFLQSQRERYAAQLANYQRLCASLGPEPVRCALYFPLLDELLSI